MARRRSPYRPPKARALARDRAIDAYGKALIEYLRARPLPDSYPLKLAADLVAEEGRDAQPRRRSYASTSWNSEANPFVREKLPGEDSYLGLVDPSSPKLAAALLRRVTATSIDLLGHEFDVDLASDGVLITRNWMQLWDFRACMDDLHKDPAYHGKDLAALIGAPAALAQVEAAMAARSVRIEHTRPSPGVDPPGLSL